MSEHQIQAAVFDWRSWRVNQCHQLRWLHSIPNGELRDIRVAKRLKKEGVTRGVPDICLPFPTFVCDKFGIPVKICGLYIEIKTATGELSGEQSEWIDGLRANGYKAEVCRGVDETIDTICEYLNIVRGY